MTKNSLMIYIFNNSIQYHLFMTKEFTNDLYIHPLIN